MKRPSKLLAGAACLAALVIPACASDGYGGGYGPPERHDIVLYEGANYSGTALPLNGAVPDLVDLSFNDAASSIRVTRGSWEICGDSNFRGRCEVITTSVRDLQPLRMNDNISSMRPVGDYGYPAGGPGSGYGSLTFFSSTNMRGEALTVERDDPDLARAGFNDRARSVDIRAGVWEVCTDGDYRGRCEVIDRPVSNLGDIGLAGNISSARLLADDRYRGGH